MRVGRSVGLRGRVDVARGGHRHHRGGVHHALHAGVGGESASSQAVAMAMACGMTRKQAVLRVALRLSTAQLVSVVGLIFAQMVTGVMVVENLFALPGLGAMLVTDVGNRDLTAVQSELFLLCAFFLLLGLVVDLLHRMLDPRLNDDSASSCKGRS